MQSWERDDCESRQTPLIVDCHVHTVRGSSDSALSLPDLVNEAARARLDGVCLTEHRGPWDRREFAATQRQHDGLFFVNAMEVESPGCHLTVFGLDRHIGGAHDPAVLRKVADSEGAFVVLAHPFRYFLSHPSSNLLFCRGDQVPPAIEEVMEHPIFDLVDAIEVANGGTSAAENALALKVAKALGKATVGGSDAHSTHGLGRFVTAFDDEFRDAEGFMAALRSGMFRAAVRDAHGTVVPCG